MCWWGMKEIGGVGGSGWIGFVSFGELSLKFGWLFYDYDCVVIISSRYLY